MRIHIFGASGCGTTTLGRKLGQVLSIPHFDTDDFFWKPTAVPFTERRLPLERIAALRAATESHGQWVLSGSMCGWGDVLIPEFTRMIFLTADWETRRERILRRERLRYGATALAPGGPMAEVHENFMAWSARYDTAAFEQRSRATHEAWIGNLAPEIRLLRLDGGLPEEGVLAEALAGLKA